MRINSGAEIEQTEAGGREIETPRHPEDLLGVIWIAHGLVADLPRFHFGSFFEK